MPRRLTSTPQSVRAGDHGRLRPLVRRSCERLGEVGGPDERRAVLAQPGRRRRGRRLRRPGGERVVGRRLAERVRGVPDRPVAGAPAQVAAERVQVEAVGPVLGVGAGARWPAARSGAVVLGRHAADEAGRAVAALRAAAHRHLVLDRVQRVGVVPSPSAVTTSWPSSDGDGTRQALIATHSVAAATPGRATRTEQAPHSPSAQPSLAAGETLLAQEVEGGGPGGDITQGACYAR